MITPLIAYFASRAQADDARIFAKKVFTIRKLIFFAIHKKRGSLTNFIFHSREILRV